jgi:hypothetical protein
MEETDQLAEMPDECAKELKAYERRQVLGLLTFERVKITHVIDVGRFSRLNNLLRTTAYVLRFIQLLKGQIEVESLSVLRTQAEIMWVVDCQRDLTSDNMFGSWKQQLSLFTDSHGLWRAFNECQFAILHKIPCTSEQKTCLH